MDFTKMQGIGNDYVYVDCFKEQVKEPGAVARFISDRRFGIGSDGLILICPSRIADCRMEMYNTDGSQGKMCGNGIRCVGKYVYDHGLVPSDRRSLTVETLAGVKELRLEVEEGKAVRLTVDMGKPSLTSEISESVTIEGKEWNFTGIDVGNPHAVYFVEDTDSLDLEKMGPHFAVGDTCYRFAEDSPMYNPDGKEVIARDNEISILRKENMEKAYFSCHTDITIPYNELGDILAVEADSSQTALIRAGRFVLPGTEELNKALDSEAL